MHGCMDGMDGMDGTVLWYCVECMHAWMDVCMLDDCSSLENATASSLATGVIPNSSAMSFVHSNQ